MNLIYIIIASVVLVIGIILKIALSRNYFNKYKYIRLVTYNENMQVQVQYIKHNQFNKDNRIVINPKHVYNFKGYTTVITTSNSPQSINPIDFESKFDKKHFDSAISSKLIAETFASMKVDKFDKIMFLVLLNAIQLIAIVYLLYITMGSPSV